MGHKDTKLCLSTDQIDFMENIRFFELKRGIINNVVGVFGELEQEYQNIISDYEESIPSDAFRKRGKISRGENYKGLPYVILDHPSTFSKQGIFAFRTLMWWGNPISFTFHLSGIYCEKHVEKVIHSITKPEFGDLLVCINKNQFEHHFDNQNYRVMKTFLDSGGNLQSMIAMNGFLKITKTIPITEFNEVSATGPVFLHSILKMLQ